MSQIGTNVYPNTTFPDSVQTLPSFTDLSTADETNYINYLKQIIAGNITAANTYLNQITNTAVLDANKLNILRDTIAAIQDVYGNTTTFSDIVAEKQAEWEAIIERFGYVGVWNDFSAYVSGTVYNYGDIVLYNDKVWYCKLNNTNVAPSEGANWKQYYYENTMVGYTDSLTNRFLLYIATTDITNNINPYESSQWQLLSKIGDVGFGFNFFGSWDSTTTYSMDNLVVYNGNAYVSLQNGNTNHTPSTSTTWWRKEFSISMQPIPIQSAEPTNQNVGDIWFQIV